MLPEWLGVIDILLVVVLLALLAYAVSAMRAALKDKSTDAIEGLVAEKHMHHIPYSVEQIRDALLGLLNTGEKPPRDLIAIWKEFMLKVELYYAAKYHLEKEDVLDAYSKFDPAIARDKGGSAEEERKFLALLKEMLKTANFAMISKEEMETATSQTFLSSVPIEADWSKMEPLAFAHSKKEKQPGNAGDGKDKGEADEKSVESEEEEEHPDFVDKLWIFHRGMGAEKFRGLLTMNKVDIFLERILGKCCGPRRKVNPPGVPDAPPPPLMGTEFTRGRVERISLVAQVAREGWKTLFKPTVIQEPTFKEVVLVYRVKNGADSLHATSNPQAIYLKVFRDIPHADLETLYPCKTTRMSALDLVKFIGVGASAIVSMLMQRQAGDLAGTSALAGFVGLLVTVVFNYQRQLSLYEQQTLGDIYRKTKDADKGAVNYVMDEVGLQEVKEVLLAYWFLSHSSKPRTAKQLDEEVEAFLFELQTVYGSSECKIDFEVADALHKLRLMKLITEEEPGHFSAIPVVEAAEAITALWSSINEGDIPSRLSVLPSRPQLQ